MGPRNVQVHSVDVGGTERARLWKGGRYGGLSRIIVTASPAS
jgi:hypothetical protein